MTYQETLNFLFERLPMFQRVGAAAFKKDLSNTLALCKALGNPEKSFKSIHVAGTNGKGSTSHSLAAILQVAGYKTGLYTSPHLKSFTERIKINGIELPEAFVINFVEKHKLLILEIKPSFFEITVVMAFDYFAKEKVEIAIIEVGMGGRFDSTNVIDPLLSVITSIGLDHKEFLGDTLEAIAFEKAGIIKNNRPVVISERQALTISVFENKAVEMNATIYFAQDDIQVEFIGIERGFRVVSSLISGTILPQLLGAYQRKNLPGILKAAHLLPSLGYTVTEENIKQGLEQVVDLTGIKGRWQKLNDSPITFCDTAHNEDGIREIINQISRYEFDKLWIIMGTVRDKDLSSILQLWPKESNYIFCEAQIPRALPAEQLLEMAKENGLKGQVIKDVNDALEFVKNKASISDFIFIGGSTFVLAELNSL